jgi:hypothetical protein
MHAESAGKSFKNYPNLLLQSLLKTLGRNYASETGVKLRLLVEVSPEGTLVFCCEEKQSVPERLHLCKTREDSYQAVAETLSEAEEILLLGAGTDAHRATMGLKEFLMVHHPAVARKIVGVLTMDQGNLSAGQLLQEARDFFVFSDGLAGR